METPSDERMCNTSNALFLLFIYNIKIALSGILNPEKLELNIGQLKISVGGSKKDNDIHVLANDDDIDVENDERLDDYKSTKASNLEKAIFDLRKYLKSNLGKQSRESGKKGKASEIPTN